MHAMVVDEVLLNAGCCAVLLLPVVLPVLSWDRLSCC
jgi:hypothetical protein